MIKKLIKKNNNINKPKSLNEKLNEIYKKFKLAKTKTTNALVDEALIDVYAELYAFEMDNKKKAGYSLLIKARVYHLFHKIDTLRVKIMPYSPQTTSSQLKQSSFDL